MDGRVDFGQSAACMRRKYELCIYGTVREGDKSRLSVVERKSYFLKMKEGEREPLDTGQHY